ncbi:tripartite tricarboxylate transporter substrate binding protein [Roseiarcaceae bacterium H3SJ34-1]|uniref:Bug family tripartite tricarboxylate transporter substrate binding protein n=1 Tax=Terripilifer ovatus TaxID=3032367 RepID=UPI003AB9BA10|nr:tripartite tricarboxylate transporter substrate binding protein [Roseiarcaceae bacterium H3SJ34-1]
MQIKSILTALVIASPIMASPLTIQPLHAQPAISRMTMVVGAPPGGSADAAVRIVAEQLHQDLKITVLVENRPGADMLLATQYVSKRPPNGDTILYLPSGPATINPLVHPANAIDVTVGLTPLSMMVTAPLLLLVSKEQPVTGMRAFVDYAKKRPGELNYASAATTHQVATEMLMMATGIKLTPVQYTGTARSLAALLANEVQVGVLDIGSVSETVKSGGVRALSVASAERAAILPDVVTASEAGYPVFDMETWGALFGPPGMSKDLVKSLNGAIVRVIENEKVKGQLSALGLQPMPSTPDQLVERINIDQLKFAKVLKYAKDKQDADRGSR